MPKPRLPFLHHERTRHGVMVWYVRKGHGPRQRINAVYGSPEFWNEYRAKVEGTVTASKREKVKVNTLAWALDRYRNSSAWANLKQSTRRARENIFRKIPKASLDTPLADINTDAIRQGREKRKDKPHAANAFIKAMRSFCAWCVDEGLMATNPTIGVKMLVGANDANGFHTWTQEEIERFETYWRIGTRERLAFDLLLYTGLRRGDAVRVGKQNVQNGVIVLQTEKHRFGKAGEQIAVPILPPLAQSIAATKTGDLVFLINERGQPWAKESFGNWFRDVCREAGCPGSAHGLRKAGATRAAEQGATERQLMAIFGWTTSKQATHYTRAADRARLARDAASLLMPGQSANKNLPHLASGAGAKPKSS